MTAHTGGSKCPGDLPWVDEQVQVITAPAEARILVDAGPGTGKTAVACARIAWLIDHAGLVPSDIWLVSFTRTAVHELRNRVGTYLSDPLHAAGIRIATIDAHAWAIQSGFNQEAALSGGYDENIRNVIKLIQTHEGVFEYVGGVRHLFIDEAQDVVGPRVELLLELINALPAEAGVTVLCDEAQAIYGFAEDGTGQDIGGTLPESIREFLGDAFRELELKEIHRTEDKTLIELFTEGRSLLKDGDLEGAELYAEVRSLIEGTNHGDLGRHREDLQNLPADMESDFLLFRKRGDALEASSYLKLRPHRIRMSGLPHCIKGWIATIFWDWTDSQMGRTEFEARWKARLTGLNATVMAKAWADLVRIVGRTETRIDVSGLARRLAGGSPPIEFCDPDFGFGGPLVGTIHGAKGREAQHVRLYLSPGRLDEGDPEELAEEARVMFVGASRARTDLKVGQAATKVHARSLDRSGRAFTCYYYNCAAAVEVGRNGDLDPEGIVGRACFESAQEVIENQERIRRLGSGLFNARGSIACIGSEWRYAIESENWPDEALLYLSPRVNYDLFEIARIVDATVHRHRTRPPKSLLHLRTFGTRTMVVGPSDPIRETLHAPWRDSGFMIAPLLLGYGMSYFH